MTQLDVFEKCLALVFSVMILGQAYLVRRYVGTWLFPACLFGLFWFGYTFVPLAILLWVPVNPYATGFLFVCALAFSMGSLAFDWKTAFARNAWKRETTVVVYSNPFLKGTFYVSTLSALVFVILNSLAQGVSLHDLFFNLILTAATYRDLVSYESLDVNIFERLGTLCAFLGAILGGLLYRGTPTKTGRRVIVVLSFLPPIFMAVAQSSKWTLFASIAFFWAGILVHRTSAGSLRLLEKGSIRSFALYAAVLIPVTIVSFLSRGLYDRQDVGFIISRLVSYFASYACNHLYAFSDWFLFTTGGHSTLTYAEVGATHGYYTFAPLFRALGLHNVLAQRIFDEYYFYGDLLNGNIYTMFRGLITDFGFIGSVLFMLVTGFLLHWAFQALLRNRRPVFTVAVFVFTIGFFYWSFGVSMLSVSTTYLTFAVLCVVLQVNKLVARTAGRGFAMATEVTAPP